MTTHYAFTPGQPGFTNLSHKSAKDAATHAHAISQCSVILTISVEVPDGEKSPDWTKSWEGLMQQPISACRFWVMGIEVTE